MTDNQLVALNTRFDQLADRNHITSVTIEFKQTYTTGSKRFTIPREDLIDITAVGSMIFIEYFVDSIRSINIEMHPMEEILTVYFDSIPTRSQQPF